MAGAGRRSMRATGWAVGVLWVASHGAGAAAQSSARDGVFTSAQASRGARTFEQVCAACHETGEFSGGRFELTWVGRTAGDLYDSISTLMPEGDPGSLSSDEYAALVAFLLRLNGYPAGPAPLPADEMVLQMVEIDGAAR